jgi:RimJ/RimL family protein N-acetyltransferase
MVHRCPVRPVPAADVAALRSWFAPERPGPVIYEHVLNSGYGQCRVDRWPAPRVVLAEVAENIALRGDPAALTRSELAEITGLVEAPQEWLPVLRESDPDLAVWPRVVTVLPATAPTPPPHPHVHRLTAADADLLAALPADVAWIHESWDGIDGLLQSGVGYGFAVDGKIVSVAVTFFRGGRYEDIGVVTVAEHRRKGLSTACAAAVVADIRARGHIPTWTTSPDNTASLAVAARLGFEHQRDDVLYAVRTPIPS